MCRVSLRPPTLSGYSHLCYKDDDLKGKLVNDRARNGIPSCLSGLSKWNLLSMAMTKPYTQDSLKNDHSALLKGPVSESGQLAQFYLPALSL